MPSRGSMTRGSRKDESGSSRAIRPSGATLLKMSFFDDGVVDSQRKISRKSSSGRVRFPLFLQVRHLARVRVNTRLEGGMKVKKLIAVLLAAMFAGASLSAIAADKPTPEQCKKNPKMEGCPKK